jgi:hypothetical protein
MSHYCCQKSPKNLIVHENEKSSEKKSGNMSIESLAYHKEGANCYVDAVKRLQDIIMAKACEYSECFDNFERSKNSIRIYLGDEKFWVLDIRTIDLKNFKG